MVLERRIRGSQVYGIQQYEDLDLLLGEQWHLRVVNINGDFSCALLKTVQFYAMHPKSILDFSVDVSQATSSGLTLTPYFIKQQPTLIFQFVRKDMNKCQLINLLTEGPDNII